MRKTLLILGALALAALPFVMRVSDKQRAASSLEAAYTARAAGELCFSSVAAGWEVAQWAGVGLYKDGPDFQEWARVAEIVDVQTNTPMLFGKSRVSTRRSSPSKVKTRVLPGSTVHAARSRPRCYAQRRLSRTQRTRRKRTSGWRTKRRSRRRARGCGNWRPRRPSGKRKRSKGARG